MAGGVGSQSAPSGPVEGPVRRVEPGWGGVRPRAVCRSGREDPRVAKVTGMASRLVRGTAIGCGVAAVAGAGFGFAVGQPVEPDDIVAARTMPADLCTRIGDVSGLLPKASSAA